MLLVSMTQHGELSSQQSGMPPGVHHQPAADMDKTVI
jgi:hypothetical protein